MKWLMMILFNLILYPCFKSIWKEIDEAKETQKIEQEKKEYKCRGLMRECIMVDFTEEEKKMIELIAYKNDWLNLKDKQILRKIVMNEI